MRYFLHLAYNGADYSGWQIQPTAPSVQQTLQEGLSMVLRRPVEVTGCGRTDAGVHADSYWAHVELAEAPPARLAGRLNRIFPTGLAVRALVPVPDDAHARFDATYRAYRYELTGEKDPFRPETIYHFPQLDLVDEELLRAAAALLLEFEEFAPFCKTNSDAHTMRCTLFRSEWVRTGPYRLDYHVAANRFLRGMVRLIVGMCLNVGMGKLGLASVRRSLDRQEPLARALSVPPQGLYLTEVRYPYDALLGQADG
ncbi:MAG: tRNA pseudouridine synthase A [Saprospiraceae bacterium]